MFSLMAGHVETSSSMTYNSTHLQVSKNNVIQANISLMQSKEDGGMERILDELVEKGAFCKAGIPLRRIHFSYDHETGEIQSFEKTKVAGIPLENAGTFEIVRTPYQVRGCLLTPSSDIATDVILKSAKEYNLGRGGVWIPEFYTLR